MNIQTLGPGDFVKVVRDAQRMWFEIVAIDGGHIIARLVSEPAVSVDWNGGMRPLPIQPTLKRGDVIECDYDDVIGILPKEAK
jgi:hypothetical protein